MLSFNDNLLQGNGAECGTKNIVSGQAKGGVAYGRCKVSLMDVDSEADNGLLDRGGTKFVFNEDAAELTVSPIDVVGPFDAQVSSGIGNEFGYDVADSESDKLREDKLLVGTDESGEMADATQEVLSTCRLPCVATLSPSCSLIVSHNCHIRLL